jgi:hypothetical protein
MAEEPVAQATQPWTDCRWERPFVQQLHELYNSSTLVGDKECWIEEFFRNRTCRELVMHEHRAKPRSALRTVCTIFPGQLANTGHHAHVHCSRTTQGTRSRTTQGTTSLYFINRNQNGQGRRSWPSSGGHSQGSGK